MKIKTLRGLGIGWPRLSEGQEADVANDVGRALIERGLAIQLADDLPAAIHAVPPPATLTTDPPPATIVSEQEQDSEDNDAGTPAERLTRKQRRQQAAEAARK